MKIEPDNVAKLIGGISLLVGLGFAVPAILAYWTKHEVCQRVLLKYANDGDSLSCEAAKARESKEQEAEKKAKQEAPVVSHSKPAQ